jgi:hypothetical protein
MDAFFFLQLLLPVCDPKRSGIKDDPRVPFCTKVEGWTQKYAHSIGLGGSYGHEFKAVMVPELVHFESVLVRDGVHGGSNGALHRR